MKKILVIEDDESYRNLLTHELANSDFQLLFAEDGEIGLKLALQEQPELILLDIIMPTMDGITMLTELRKNEYGKAVKVIILSNVDLDPMLQDNVSKSENTYYRVKSGIKITELIELISELTNESPILKVLKPKKRSLNKAA